MARRPHEQLPSDPSELEGLTKAAILVLTLEPDQASTVLKSMTSDAVEEVTRELAGLGRVPNALQRAVVEEFYSTALAMQSANEGSLDHAKRLLQDALDPTMASKIMQQIQTQVQKTPFAF